MHTWQQVQDPGNPGPPEGSVKELEASIASARTATAEGLAHHFATFTAAMPQVTSPCSCVVSCYVGMHMPLAV